MLQSSLFAYASVLRAKYENKSIIIFVICSSSATTTILLLKPPINHILTHPPILIYEDKEKTLYIHYTSSNTATQDWRVWQKYGHFRVISKSRSILRTPTAKDLTPRQLWRSRSCEPLAIGSLCKVLGG